MNKPTLPQLRKMVEAAMARDKETIELLGKSENPQVVEMVTRVRGRLEAFEAVQWACQGDCVLLKISSG